MMPGRFTLSLGFALLCSAFFNTSLAQNYDIKRISSPNSANRDPVISETGNAAWTYYATNEQDSAYSHIALYDNARKLMDDKTLLLFVGASKLVFQSNNLAFVSSYLDTKMRRLQRPGLKLPGETNVTTVKEGSLDSYATNAVSFNFSELEQNDKKSEGVDLTTVWVWSFGGSNVQRMEASRLNNIAPDIWGNLITWQWEQDWPFGYEIMYLKGVDAVQLTTNKNYDLGPVTHGDKIAWFGWDGYDYEVFLFDTTQQTTIQITSNRFDDTGVQLFNDVLVWEGYAGVEADIYVWKNGETVKISDNLDDDVNPRIWDGKVVWQGFDGDDFELYLYDVNSAAPAVKLTSNNYDDTNPDIHNGLIAWMGYHDNWDAEIFVADVSGMSSPANLNIIRLTDNDDEDRDVRTAGGRLVWVNEEIEGKPQIMLAEPR